MARKGKAAASRKAAQNAHRDTLPPQRPHPPSPCYQPRGHCSETHRSLRLLRCSLNIDRLPLALAAKRIKFTMGFLVSRNQFSGRKIRTKPAGCVGRPSTAIHPGRQYAPIRKTELRMQTSTSAQLAASQTSTIAEACRRFGIRQKCCSGSLLERRRDYRCMQDQGESRP